MEKTIRPFSSVQLLSYIQLSATLWTAARQASMSITNSQSSLRLTSIESVMPSNHLILCHLLLILPSIFPSNRVFSNESTLRMRWPKYWSFSFNIIPSKEIPELISFRMDWLDLLAVQGTLKSLLQHHSSKAQETQTGALCQPRRVRWGGRWEGGSEGRGYVCTYGWFMLRFDRKQQDSIKQLSVNKKLID